jgi:hypothetical protein
MSNTFYKIPKVENVILCLQFPFLIQNPLVSSGVVKLNALQKGVELKEMHHPKMKWIPWLRQKILTEKNLLIGLILLLDTSTTMW